MPAPARFSLKAVATHGFGMIAAALFLAPIAWTIPCPTRATTVSSVAPPTSCSRFVRTVTRARARSSMPSPHTALSVASGPGFGSGQSMTLG